MIKGLRTLVTELECHCEYRIKTGHKHLYATTRMRIMREMSKQLVWCHKHQWATKPIKALRVEWDYDTQKPPQ